MTTKTTSEQQRQRQMRNGLLPEARHLILPDGIKSSGFPAVRETCRQVGITFDDWQRDLNKCLLAKNSHGLYASDTAVLSIPRQVGKTYDVGAVAFALCIAFPGLTVVWTAHRFKVARESFNEMRSWGKRSELVPHIDYDAITTAAGNECIPFRNGSRIVFAARERGAVRGFTKVGMLVLDEAQILTEAALSDLVPTTNQAPNPLIILMGTPPKPTDPGEAFTRLRQEALDAESRDVLYVEFSAELGCDPNDRKQWAVANPSYPRRTSARAIQRMKKLLSAEDFMREGLGVWDPESTDRPINPAAWSVLAKPHILQRRPANMVPTFFVHVAPESTHASITVAYPVDERPFVELADYRPGTSWMPARCAELDGKHPGGVWRIEAAGAAGAELPALKDEGIIPEEFTAREMGQACAHLQQLVKDKAMWHSGDAAFSIAVQGAVARPVGEGLWVFSSRKSSVDVTPITGAAGALWALESDPGLPQVF